MKLKKLAFYLRGLPASLPITSSFSRYNFNNFELNEDWIKTIGTVEGVVNRELEVQLGTRADGPIEFFERGLAVEALVGVLDRYIRQFPEDELLKIWVDDALAGAKHTYSKANLPVSFQSTLYLRLTWILKCLPPTALLWISNISYIFFSLYLLDKETQHDTYLNPCSEFILIFLDSIYSQMTPFREQSFLLKLEPLSFQLCLIQ